MITDDRLLVRILFEDCYKAAKSADLLYVLQRLIQYLPTLPSASSALKIISDEREAQYLDLEKRCLGLWSRLSTSEKISGEDIPNLESVEEEFRSCLYLSTKVGKVAEKAYWVPHLCLEGERLTRKLDVFLLSSGEIWRSLQNLVASVEKQPKLCFAEPGRFFRSCVDLWEKNPFKNRDYCLPQYEEVKAVLPYLESALDFHMQKRAFLSDAVSRYAYRSATLMREALLGYSSEADLTKDVALFLFDQGFSVQTEVSRGNVRYDLVVGQGKVLVESKRLVDTKGAKQVFLEGARQLFGYLRELQTQGEYPEGYLFIFWQSGQGISFPGQVTVNDLRLNFVEISLASSEVRGSRSRKRVFLSEEQIRSAIQEEQ